MAFVRLSLAGANEWNGTILDFTDLTLPSDNLDFLPVISIMSINTSAIANTLPQITVKLQEAGEAADRSMLLKNLQDKPGFATVGCNIFVPRQSDGTPWVFQVFTPGKTVNATLYVNYGVGQIRRLT